MLELQHSVAGAADQDAEAGRDLDGLLGIGNQNFIGHRISPLLSGLVVFRDVQPYRMP